jgi:hypothetical protein
MKAILHEMSRAEKKKAHRKAHGVNRVRLQEAAVTMQW